jgi:proteasome lid subunit RPN8/RPN11
VTAFVLKPSTDGQLRVERAVRWEYIGAVQPELSDADLRDEIRLHMRDIGVGEEPLIGFGEGGEPRLVWPIDIERTTQTLVLLFAPLVRRARRARRSARARRSKMQSVAVEAQSKRKPKDVIELVQGRDGRWLRTEVGGERLVVAASVLDSVRRHADEVHRARPGHEAFGALVLDDDGRVLRYARLRNFSRQPHHVSIRGPRLARRPDGHRLIPCHSHPPGTRTTPSPRDIETAHRFGWKTFAIWSQDGLRLWRPDDGTGSVAEVGFEIVS